MKTQQPTIDKQQALAEDERAGFGEIKIPCWVGRVVSATAGSKPVVIRRQSFYFRTSSPEWSSHRFAFPFSSSRNPLGEASACVGVENENVDIIAIARSSSSGMGCDRDSSWVSAVVYRSGLRWCW